jgi:hypothetical protein
MIELLIRISPVTRILKQELQVSNKEYDKMNENKISRASEYNDGIFNVSQHQHSEHDI